jgi:hypothetical protein
MGEEITLETKEEITLDLYGYKFIFENQTFTILKRKKNLEKKPTYYCLNLDTKYYLSSLYPSSKPNTYFFDVKDDGEYLITFYPDKTYKIEEL